MAVDSIESISFHLHDVIMEVIYMVKRLRILAAMLLATMLFILTPAQIANAATLDVTTTCPYCGSDAVGTLTISYPNAWEGGHQVHWHYHFHCLRSYNSHYWDNDYYENQPHTFNGNICTACGYIGH